MGTGYISSKRTDGKLIWLEISISRNISVHETVKEKIICSKPKINTATKTMKLKNRSLLAQKISIDKNLKLAIKREKSKFHSLKTFWTFSQLIQRRCAHSKAMLYGMTGNEAFHLAQNSVACTATLFETVTCNIVSTLLS